MDQQLKHLGEHRLAELIQAAIAKFTRTTGLQTKVGENGPQVALTRETDAVVSVQLANGARVEFIVEAKLNLDRAVALVAAKQKLEPYADRGLLIAPYLTAELATVCRQRLRLQFMDAAGNAFIDRPGLFVFVMGERRTDTHIPDAKGGTATRLRIIFALLCRPELVNAPYREIAEAAGVALGSVGWALHDLEARGFAVGGKTKRTRRLIEPRRLMDEWVTNYAIKLRPKLNPQRFRAPEGEWWREAKLTNLSAYWGAEVAADRLTDYLKPAAYTIYIDPAMRRNAVTTLVTTNHFRAEPNGNVEILDTFWRLPKGTKHPDVVPPLLAYADLVATLDPRNIEAANMIRAKYIDVAVHAA
jgi:hypothetical protein